jgi:hypothetical protein
VPRNHIIFGRIGSTGLIGVILIYGVNDAFGKQAMLIAAPIIVVVLYLMLPPVAS